MMQGNGAGSGSKAGESAEASWHGGSEYARSGVSKREKDWHEAGAALHSIWLISSPILPIPICLLRCCCAL